MAPEPAYHAQRMSDILDEDLIWLRMQGIETNAGKRIDH
jgi:hypothetical protein